jgi:hypothetical protein
MSSTDAPPIHPTIVAEAQITRSPDWKVVYCNILGIGWGDNEARLMIAFDEDLANSGTKVREGLLVVMPHRAAKLLVHTLGSIIANHEANHGPIPYPAERLQEIDKAIKEQAERGRPPKK